MAMFINRKVPEVMSLEVNQSLVLRLPHQGMMHGLKHLRKEGQDIKLHRQSALPSVQS